MNDSAKRFTLPISCHPFRYIRPSVRLPLNWAFMASKAVQTLHEIGHSKKRWSWVSVEPQRMQPRLVEAWIRSWVPRRPLMANHIIKLALGIAWGNHTSLYHDTLGRTERMVDYRDLVVKISQAEGIQHTLSLEVQKGSIEVGMESVRVRRSVEFATGQTHCPSRIMETGISR